MREKKSADTLIIPSTLTKQQLCIVTTEARLVWGGPFSRNVFSMFPMLLCILFSHCLLSLALFEPNHKFFSTFSTTCLHISHSSALFSHSPLSTPAFSVSIFTLSLPSCCRLSLFLTPSSFSMLSLSISRHSFSVHVLSTTVCFLLPSFSVRCHMHKNSYY